MSCGSCSTPRLSAGSDGEIARMWEDTKRLLYDAGLKAGIVAEGEAPAFLVFVLGEDSPVGDFATLAEVQAFARGRREFDASLKQAPASAPRAE